MKQMTQKENHSLYNDADGKTKAVMSFLESVRAPKVYYTRDKENRLMVSVENHTRPYLRVVNEAVDLATRGKLDEALELVGYKNDRSPLDLYFDQDGNRVRQ